MILKAKTFIKGLEFPEGPRWYDDKLWFSDMAKSCVMTADMKGHVRPVVNVPAQPSGLGMLPDGSLLIVSMGDRRLLRYDSGKIEQVADLSDLASYVLNDMVVNSNGWAYVGNFGFALFDPSAIPRLAEIILVKPDGNSRIVAYGMSVPNGSIITPCGKTLIVAETLASRLTAFDIHPDGSLSNRRIFAQFDDLGFDPQFDSGRIAPDGICLDMEGAVWVASPTGASEVMRVLEGGAITHRVKVDDQPLAVILGGPDRKTLFICTSILGYRRPGAGCIQFVQVEVPGSGFP